MADACTEGALSARLVAGKIDIGVVAGAFLRGVDAWVAKWIFMRYELNCALRDQVDVSWVLLRLEYHLVVRKAHLLEAGQQAGHEGVCILVERWEILVEQFLKVSLLFGWAGVKLLELMLGHI